MGTVIFKNPNEPRQPVGGTYRWYCVDESGSEVPLYIGQAGGKRSGPVRYPSTLGRGISELQRGTLSADGGRTLDVDFIVGTLIRYLQDEGYDCIWEHLSNDPHEERERCRQQRPMLQDDAGNLHQRFKLARPDGGLWNSGDESHVKEAERLLHRLFKQSFPMWAALERHMSAGIPSF